MTARPGLHPADPADRAASARLGQAVRAALEPVLLPHGFAAGQVGFSPDDVGVVFCGPYREVRARLPGLCLPAEPDAETWCADVVVDVSRGDERLVGAGLEGADVPDLLRSVGRDDLAPRAQRLGGLPLEAALAELAALLGAALEAAREAGREA